MDVILIVIVLGFRELTVTTERFDDLQACHEAGKMIRETRLKYQTYSGEYRRMKKSIEELENVEVLCVPSRSKG